MSTLAEVTRATSLERIRTAGAVDVAIIGAGATGGYAAYLLTQAGLRVLVLDAGLEPAGDGLAERLVRRVAGRDVAVALRRRRQPVQSRCYAWAGAPDAFVDDLDCPYTTPPERPFVWFRARRLGGRLMIPGHGRQYYRLGPADIHPPDAERPSWPLEPGELDRWYAQVESSLGLAGRHDHNRFIPDSTLTHALDFSEAEAKAVARIREQWPGADPMLGRFAVPPSFLDLAAASGRLLVRTGAIVRELHVSRAGRIAGVSWIDTQARETVRLDVPLVFLCASALESTRVLLLSRPPHLPDGIGGASHALGRHLMDHIRVTMTGTGPALEGHTEEEAGRCVYLPRFDARMGERTGRGFGVQLYQSPRPDGGSGFGASAYGEMLPRAGNRVVLHDTRVDRWGIPILHIDCAHDAHDRALAEEQIDALRELAALFEVQVTHADTAAAPPGMANHECGTARMGRDPADSVVDPRNECWDARGLFLTDGACLPSQAFQNPTLTLLALTARACAYVLERRTG